MKQTRPRRFKHSCLGKLLRQLRVTALQLIRADERWRREDPTGYYLDRDRFRRWSW